MSKQYQGGDTVCLNASNQVYTFATDTWALADADSAPTVTIIDPAGTVKVNAIGSSKVATGKYQYKYSLPTTALVGAWRGYVDVINGGDTDRKSFMFTVKA